MKHEDPEEAAFQRVRLRSIGTEQKLLAEEGGSLSGADFAARLGGQTAALLNDWIVQNKILGVPFSGTLYFPTWQIFGNALLPGLGETLSVLAAEKVSPFEIVIFFLTPAEALEDERPLDLLKRNAIDQVVRFVRHCFDQR